jgi:hypothetical protein
MRQLDVNDLELVTGAVGVPGAIVGAGGGLATYAGNVSTGPNEWDWIDAGMAVGLGAIGGAITGPVGANRAAHSVGFSGVAGVFAGGVSSVRSGTVTIGPITEKSIDSPNDHKDGTNY